MKVSPLVMAAAAVVAAALPVLLSVEIHGKWKISEYPVNLVITKPYGSQSLKLGELRLREPVLARVDVVGKASPLSPGSLISMGGKLRLVNPATGSTVMVIPLGTLLPREGKPVFARLPPGDWLVMLDVEWKAKGSGDFYLKIVIRRAGVTVTPIPVPTPPRT